MARVMSGAFSLLAGYGNVQFPVWVTHCSTVQLLVLVLVFVLVLVQEVSRSKASLTQVEIRIGVSGPCQHQAVLKTGA